MKKRVIGVMFVLLLIAAIPILLIVWRNWRIETYDIRDYSHGSDTGIPVVYAADHLNYYYTTDMDVRSGPTVFNSKYIANPVFHQKVYWSGYVDLYRVIKRFDLFIYDMITQQKTNTIDVKKYLDVYSHEWQLWDSEVSSVYREGSYYARLTLEKRPQKVSKDPAENTYENRRKSYDNTLALLYIDIKSGESFLESDGSKRVDDIRELSKIWLKFEELLMINGCQRTEIDFFPSQNQLVQISLPVASLPAENKRLYDLFPSLQEIDRESGLYVRIYLHDWKDDLGLIALLLPDGQEERLAEAFAQAQAEGSTRMEQEDYDKLADEYREYQRRQLGADSSD